MSQQRGCYSGLRFLYALVSIGEAPLAGLTIFYKAVSRSFFKIFFAVNVKAIDTTRRTVNSRKDVVKQTLPASKVHPLEELKRSPRNTMQIDVFAAQAAQGHSGCPVHPNASTIQSKHTVAHPVRVLR